MNYRQPGTYADYRIDNQMTINSKGEHLTQCWDSKGVYFVKTDPKSIRKPMACGLWQAGQDDSDFSKRATFGNTTKKM